MSTESFIEQVRKLKASLEELEKRLAGADVPLAVLEDFKMAVDHIRMTVWALLSAEKTDLYEAAASVARFRLKRTVEMSRSILLDINAGNLTIDMAELQQFHAFLKDTLERIDRLYRTGI